MLFARAHFFARMPHAMQWLRTPEVVCLKEDVANVAVSSVGTCVTTEPKACGRRDDVSEMMIWKASRET